MQNPEEKVAVEQEQARNAKMQNAVSWGATILSAVLGRKKLSSRNIGRATTAASQLCDELHSDDCVDPARYFAKDHPKDDGTKLLQDPSFALISRRTSAVGTTA